MNLGERLFELRKAKNLTQDDVAEKLNVSRQTVSKWETDQSTPDFDKIVPLCELFEIGVDELLTGKKPVEEKKQENVLTKQEVNEKSAQVVSSSVFLYFLALVILIVCSSVLNIDPIIAVAIFFLLIGFATTRIIRHYMSIPKFEQTEEEIQIKERQKSLQKQINEIIMSIAGTIYFIVSFLTMAWHVTWIIFIIASLICQVVKLVFLLKGDEKDEK